MKGKEKCKILKEIRQKIATENDIPFVTSECKHQGDCRGTCPKCEAELVYLENELAKRRLLGKRVMLAGLVATFAVTGTACDFGETISSGHKLMGDMLSTQDTLGGEEVPEDDLGGAQPLPPEDDQTIPEELLPCTLQDGMYVFQDGVTLPTMETLYTWTEEQIAEAFAGIDGLHLRSAYQKDLLLHFPSYDTFFFDDDKEMQVDYDKNGIFLSVAILSLLPTPGDPA